MKKEEILKEASYCLNCNHTPCKSSCPIHTEIPKFIYEIKNGNNKEAYKILIKNNIFSCICSQICPQEEQCEGNCVRGIKGQAVKIGKLEYEVNKWAKENNIEYKEKIENEKLEKIAVIGSGPASLSAARELRLNGYQVTVFEKDEEYGGILRYGIPDFRLNKNDLDYVINKLKELNIKFINNSEFGKDFTIDSLKKDKYNAIFLGIGAQKPFEYKLSNNNLKNIYTSDEFLKRYAKKQNIKNLGKLAVIGGGNVAIDCSRVAIKMNAKKVYILYRRDRENMPARDIEIQDALNDGVEIHYLTRVLEAVGEDEIQKVKCIKTKIENKKAVDIENSEFYININTIVFAIGLSPEKNLLNKMGIELDDYGLVKINEENATNIDGVYAGGDIISSKLTVCKAIQDGKKSAKSIINYLKS